VWGEEADTGEVAAGSRQAGGFPGMLEIARPPASPQPSPLTRARTRGAGRQVAGLRQLHKADPVGRGYTVVGFGSQCVPQMLALALALHDAARALNAKAAAAAGGGPHARWVVRVGVARGSVATGGLGLKRQRCHFFGGPVAEAARLARECPAGETRVQRSLTKAEGAGCFAFAPPPPAPGPPAPSAAAGPGGAAPAGASGPGRAGPGAVGLSGRRGMLAGLGGGPGGGADGGR
jgi:hypothetical protein